jgi:hypothetical protein
MSSALLSLPYELRSHICLYALTAPAGGLIFNSAKRRFEVSSIGAGLLTTCRSLYWETRYLPLELSHWLMFNVPLPSVWFMVLLAKVNRLSEHMGRTVQIHVVFSSGMRWNRQLSRRGIDC